MELCNKVQVEEYVIHVVASTNFYTHLQFFLLASTWFPRPLGVCLWSVLHMLLVLGEALMLLVLFPIVFVLAVLRDACIVAYLIYMVLIIPIIVIISLLGTGLRICVALVWIWLMVVLCLCCVMRGRAAGQGLGHYDRTAGGPLPPHPQDPQPAPAVEGGSAAAHGPCAFLKALCRAFITLRFVKHVILVSFPYWRVRLGDWCREIVPSYDPIVI